jgi:tetratricopeptide (TPR) repeat protein
VRKGASVALFTFLCACGSSPAPEARPATAAAATPPASTASPPSGDNGGAELDRAVVAIKANDFRSAKAALDQALQKNPKNGAASYYMGVALENLGDKTGAEQRYKDAMRDAPEVTEAAINLGALYLDASRWDEALEVTKKGLARRSDDPGLHANMAMALRGKGDKEGAAAHYEQAVRVVGDNADLRYAYGSLLLEMGNKQRATTELKAAMGAAGGNRALLASIGRMLGAAGAFADCVAALDRAIDAADDAELRVRRGLCRHSLGDEGGARRDFEAAIKLNAKFAPAHYYLGEALLAGGSAAQASKEFELAAAAAPETELGKKAKAQAEAARKAKKK